VPNCPIYDSVDTVMKEVVVTTIISAAGVQCLRLETFVCFNRGPASVSTGQSQVFFLASFITITRLHGSELNRLSRS
jgi:hypothetical protein